MVIVNIMLHVVYLLFLTLLFLIFLFLLYLLLFLLIVRYVGINILKDAKSKRVLLDE